MIMMTMLTKGNSKNLMSYGTDYMKLEDGCLFLEVL